MRQHIGHIPEHRRADVQEWVRDEFLARLMSDADDADFFEAQFDLSILALRTDAIRRFAKQDRVETAEAFASAGDDAAATDALDRYQFKTRSPLMNEAEVNMELRRLRALLTDKECRAMHAHHMLGVLDIKSIAPEQDHGRHAHGRQRTPDTHLSQERPRQVGPNLGDGPVTSHPAADARLSDLLLALATETDMWGWGRSVRHRRGPRARGRHLVVRPGMGRHDERGEPERGPRAGAGNGAGQRRRLMGCRSGPRPVRRQVGKRSEGYRHLGRSSLSILSKLCQRLVDATTIPLVLVRALAPHLNVKPGELFAFLDLQPTLAPADYRSTVRPEVSEKMSFAAAVQSTDMPAGQRDKSLSLAE